jgi:hypothetical protein
VLSGLLRVYRSRPLKTAPQRYRLARNWRAKW